MANVFSDGFRFCHVGVVAMERRDDDAVAMKMGGHLHDPHEHHVVVSPDGLENENGLRELDESHGGVENGSGSDSRRNCLSASPRSFQSQKKNQIRSQNCSKSC